MKAKKHPVVVHPVDFGHSRVHEGPPLNDESPHDWGYAMMHECPPWHTPDNHFRTLRQAIREWWRRVR